MPKKEKPEFVRFNTIKDYIKEKEKMRSNEDAVNNLTERFNSLIERIMVPIMVPSYKVPPCENVTGWEN